MIACVKFNIQSQLSKWPSELDYLSFLLPNRWQNLGMFNLKGFDEDLKNMGYSLQNNTEF